MNIFRNNKIVSGERLDEASLKLLRASSLNEDAAAEVASSPFIFARLKARINAEREQNQAKESWLAWVGVLWQAAPVMVLLVIFSFVLFWMTNSLSPRTELNDRAVASESETEQLFFGEGEQVSSDEFLATILSRDKQKQ